MEMTEHDFAQKLAAHSLTPPGYDVPEVPQEQDWRRWARLKALNTASPMTATPFSRSFVTAMDHLSMSPEFRTEAQRVALEYRKETRARQIEFTKTQIESIDVAQWGMAKKSIEQAQKLLNGTAAPVPGVGVPVFDANDYWGVLRIENGAAVVAGVTEDLNRLRDLRNQLDKLESEQASDTTDDEIAKRTRAARIAAAKREAKPVTTAKAPEDFDKATYAAGRKLARDLQGASAPLK